jgi:hypothetical protein
MRCKICNEVEKRKKLLLPQFDGLQKHVGHMKAIITHMGVVVN